MGTHMGPRVEVRARCTCTSLFKCHGVRGCVSVDPTGTRTCQRTVSTRSPSISPPQPCPLQRQGSCLALFNPQQEYWETAKTLGRVAGGGNWHSRREPKGSQAASGRAGDLLLLIRFVHSGSDRELGDATGVTPSMQPEVAIRS